MIEILGATVAHEVHTSLDCASVALGQALARVQGVPVHAVDAVLARELGLALESLTLARAVVRDAMQQGGRADVALTTDLSREVDGVLRLAEIMKPAHVVVVPKLEPSLRVLGTATHVQRIALSLVLNAFRGLEDQDLREDGVVRVTTSVSGRRGRLVVEDDGPGLPSPLRARSFEPFAATRGAGRGPGLGLHEVQRIILTLGGTIDFKSDQGRGTVVVVELPRPA